MTTYNQKQQQTIKDFDAFSQKGDKRSLVRLAQANPELKDEFTRIGNSQISQEPKKIAPKKITPEKQQPQERLSETFKKNVTQNTQREKQPLKMQPKEDEMATIGWREVKRNVERADVGNKDFFDRIQQARELDNDAFQGKLEQDQNMKRRVQATETYFIAKQEADRNDKKEQQDFARNGFSQLLTKNPKDPYVDEYIKSYPELRSEFTLQKEQALIDYNSSQNASQYMWSSSSELATAVDKYELLPWTSSYESLIGQNPNIWTLNSERNQNFMIGMINGEQLGSYDTQKASQAILQQIVENFTNSADDLEVYDTFLNSEWVQQASQDIASTEGEIIGIQESLEGIEVAVQSELPAGVPEAIINGEVANRSRWLYKKAEALFAQKQSQEAHYNRMSEQAAKRFSVWQGQEQKKQSFMMQMYGVVKQEELRVEEVMMQEQRYQRDIQRQEVEYQRAIERSDFEYARNIRVQQDQVQEERQYNQQIMQDGAMREMSQSLMNVWVDPTGMNYQQMVRKYTQEVQSAKQIDTQIQAYNAQKGNWTVDVENGIRYNKDTGEYQNISIGSSWSWGSLGISVVMSAYSDYGQELLSTPDGTVIPTRLDQVSPQNNKIRGKECAEMVNDILGWEKRLGNTYQSKLDVCNEKEGVVGSVASWKPQGSGEYGHTGIIVGDDGDNWLIKSSNYTPWTVTTDRIPKSVIWGYYTPNAVKDMYAKAKTWGIEKLEDVRLATKASDASKKSFWFGMRMHEAEDAIREMEESFKWFFSRTGTELAWWLVANFMKTDKRQKFEQAQRNFVNSVLRVESGAVISPEEFANAAQQYFPQPWDSKAVMEQKRKNREISTFNMFNSAGETNAGVNIADIYENIRGSQETQQENVFSQGPTFYNPEIIFS